MSNENFFHRIGDWLAGSGKYAERHFFNSRVEMLGSKGPVYLDVAVPYRLYSEIPELNQVLNRGASMFSNGSWKYEDGSEVEPELLRLLNDPNVLESLNDFLKTYYLQYWVYGNQFIYLNKTSGTIRYPQAMMNVSPSYMKPVLTGNVFEQVDLKGMIEKFQYCESGKERNFETDSIIWSKNTDLDNPLIGTSPLKSLRFPLTNTKLAYDYLNIISGDKGAIGIMSTANSDKGGALPVSKEERQRIENAYRNDHGIGVDNNKQRILVTQATVKWDPIGYPTKELLLLEQIDANKLTICDHFGFNINIFSSKSQTFENVRHAIIQTYQDTIIPFADQFAQRLTKKLKTPKRLKLDYSHLEILTNKMETLGAIVTALNQAVQGGLIDGAQAEQVLANQIGIEVPEEKKGTVLNSLNRMSPLVATKVLESFTINQRLALVGLANIGAAGDVVPAQNTNSFNQ
jgi:HK97 family phage portal protein